MNVSELAFAAQSGKTACLNCGRRYRGGKGWWLKGFVGLRAKAGFCPACLREAKQNNARSREAMARPASAESLQREAELAKLVATVEAARQPGESTLKVLRRLG